LLRWDTTFKKVISFLGYALGIHLTPRFYGSAGPAAQWIVGRRRRRCGGGENMVSSLEKPVTWTLFQHKHHHHHHHHYHTLHQFSHGTLAIICCINSSECTGRGLFTKNA